MRLWHYKLITFLPRSQLIAQWKELNLIFKNQPNHILINYVYEYSKEDLLSYSLYVLNELDKRGYRVKNWETFDNYFNIEIINNVPQLPYIEINEPFKNHHNDRYLRQCFYNLQEKYDRGQKDFDEKIYLKLERMLKE